ncbi:MAG: M20/M25/M40 family metallo-hydrolase [Candidatus Longimicrobiales bacterium M2_2A_002]
MTNPAIDGTADSAGDRPADRSFDAAIAFAADLIRIPSPPGGEEAVARRVVEELGRLGFDEAWTDEVGNAVGVIRGEGRAAPVQLSSHLDVVDAGAPEGWEHPPYGGVVADGHLHGRGAMDIKGPLALQTYAAARFVDERPAGDLVVAHTVFEERGGWGMAHFLAESGIRPGAVIIGEATGGDLCIGHRGRAEVLVEIRGLAGHASAPDRARNALDGVGPVLSAVAGFARGRLGEENPVLGQSTITATDVVAEPASRNVIPDRATVVLDWRVLPGPGPDEALTSLRSYLDDVLELPSGLEWAVDYATQEQRSWTGRATTRQLFGGGFLLDPEDPVVRAAVDGVAVATGSAPRVRPWAFATDGRHTQGEHGIPTLGYAPGEERHAHTNTERLELGAARVVYEAYPSLIRALFAVVGEG